jgi:hypothetical protein
MATVSAVWVRVWAGVRRSWLALLAVAVLIGLSGGAVLWAVSAARRTDSAMERFVAYDRPYDVAVAGLTPAQRTALLHRPEVADWAEGSYLAMGYLAPGRPFDDSQLGVINPFGFDGPHVLTGSNRPIIVEGRLADPRRADEVVVNELLVQRQHLHVGRRMRFGSYSPATWQSYQGGPFPPPDGPTVTVRIVGVIRLPADVAFTSVDQPVIYLGAQDVYFTSAFLHRYGSRIASVGPQNMATVALRAAPGRQGALARLAHRLVGSHGEVDVGSDAARSLDLSTHPIHLQVVALLAFGALAAVAGLLLIGQAVSRQTLADTDDHRQLRELGMSRGQLYATSLARALVLGVAGAVLAVGLATALSPLAPVGLARQAEIDPGVHVDLPVLGLGGLGVLLVVLLLALVPTRRAVAATEPIDATRPSRVAGVLARWGVPAPAQIGARMAFEGRRRTAASSRAALVAATTAVVALTAAVTFGASLHRLVDTPRLQGWNWDVVVGNGNDAAAPPGHPLDHLSTVAGYAETRTLNEPLQIGHLTVPGRELQTVRGGVEPIVLEGRLPSRGEEIALGRATLDGLHAHVGDLVTVGTSAARRRMRIVGEAVMVPLADTDGTTLGRGAIVAPSGAHLLGSQGQDAPEYLVRFAPGVSLAAGIRSLQPAFSGTILRPVRPQDVDDVARLDRLPGLLAGLVVLVAIGTLVHALVLSVRERRRDLGVLRTFGFTPRQTLATVTSQAVAIAVVAVVLGVPLGLAGGRWGWRLVNDGIGSLAAPTVPLVAVVVCGLAGLAAAPLLALGPGWRSARLRPAEALRTE